ncbi:MAG TPA: tRNA (N6-isopentenyl adenosine(37)-C2)-methylthiotransferase MiaB [Candidatus Acidoferrum sp.]|nr:tRNA (N6-isopentenyl adenosine(37)-C2)-methylthiotransferase MiaB [Candidatus Acidoferrum sp.]
MSQPFDIRADALIGRGVSLAAATNAALMGEATRRKQEEDAALKGSATQGKAFYIETFGCQMNEHDSEKVSGVLMSRGYRMVNDPAAADLVFYNTCSIREKAAQKVFSRLGLFNPNNAPTGDPDVAPADATPGRHIPIKYLGGAPGTRKIVGVLGCVAQQEGEEIFERAPWVSLVCGSASYRKLPELLAQLESGNRRVMGLDTDTDETFETEITRRDNPFRAYLTIIEGCDKACAYCVVPFTRGPERSRPSDRVLREVRDLADIGYSEIQLLGQTVNSYRDPSPRKVTFAELLTAVAQVRGIRRVRFTTSHPRDFHREIVDAIDTHPQLCDHIHLPVQSGSTRLLEKMLRTYTREEYLGKIAMIRAARRAISVTTDIIVGFPGETEEDFQQTLTLLDAAQYDGVFAFKFSPRPNTPALAMQDGIPEAEKDRRLAVLLDRQRQIQMLRNEQLVGSSFEVLTDNRGHKEAQWSGRTSSNRVVNFTSPRTALMGEYLPVRITRAGPNSLVGEQVV